MIEFKDYQEKAIVKLKSEVNELLESQNDEVIVFKSPTGSGKTLMTAEFDRCSYRRQKICFCLDCRQ